MNQANGYWSSPDHYWGNQMAPKIEIFNDPFWRKLRLKYEIQPFGNVKNFLIVKVPVYEPTFQCGRKNIKYFSVPIAKMLLLSILAKFLRGHLLAPPGDPGSNPAGLQKNLFFQIHFFTFFDFLPRKQSGAIQWLTQKTFLDLLRRLI